MLAPRPALLSFGLVLAAGSAAGQEVRTRTLEFEVAQVTTPAVAVSPDGNLVFTLLGHLYRVSPEAGEAVQLTRGAFFHKEPAVSPEGGTIAVVSDREATRGDNVYLVSLDGGEIRSAGIGQPPGGAAFEDATEVDAWGRFAVPGLWDAHLHGDHLGYRAPWVAHGVTSLRDPGSPILEAVQEVERDRLHGGTALPRRFTSGEIFEGFRDRWWGQFLRVTDPEVGRRAVRECRARGARFIKAYPTLPWSMHRTLAEEAVSQGLPVMGHGVFPEEIVRSVTLGYRALEHNGFPEILHDDVLMLLAAAGRYWTPQYTQWIPADGVLALKDPEGFAQGLRLLGPGEGRPPEAPRPGGPVDELLGAWALTSRQLRRARDLGVRILPGTDTCGGPGWVHVEFEAFQDAGFTPAEVLRMATLDAARAEGVDQHLGTLEVDKLADLLLLDDDPLEDVRNLRAPWLVMRGGRVVHERDGG